MPSISSRRRSSFSKSLPLAVPAWLATAATGQVSILAYPWLAAHVGNELAGRSNAAINFSVFLVAFATQYGVGLIIGLFAATATGYDPFGLSLGVRHSSSSFSLRRSHGILLGRRKERA